MSDQETQILKPGDTLNLNLSVRDQAALLTLLGSSMMLSEGEENNQVLAKIDKDLSRFHTLAELGVVEGLYTQKMFELVYMLSHTFSAHIDKHMASTREKFEKCNSSPSSSSSGESPASLLSGKSSNRLGPRPLDFGGQDKP